MEWLEPKSGTSHCSGTSSIGVAIIQMTMFDMDVMWQQVSLGQVRILWMERCHRCYLDGMDALHLTGNIKMAWSDGEKDVWI